MSTQPTRASGCFSSMMSSPPGAPPQPPTRLLRRVGADVIGISVFIELAFLNGADMLDGVPLNALGRYD